MNLFSADIMRTPSRRIVLFYKNLVCPGGAERLFAKEYRHLSALGYEVFVVTNHLKPQALFGMNIPQKSLFVLNKSGIMVIIELIRILRRLGNPPVLCSSGHLDIFLASIIGQFDYALHIHHPCFMSLNDYDKYSIIMRRHFKSYTRSNFGAARFVEIRESLSLWQRAHINLRALISIGAMRRSRHNFVLSRYAQREKSDLYGIDSDVLCGALDDDFRESGKYYQSDIHRVGLRPVPGFTLLTLARLDINKRIDELIRALGLLVAAGVDVRLRIVGDGPERAALIGLVLELGLKERVEFLGFVPDDGLQEIYATSDLFVSIDWADYKITMFESLARGLPLLVSDETECDDRLVSFGYVKAVPPVAAQVAEAIQVFISNRIQISPERVTPICRIIRGGSTSKRSRGHWLAWD